MDGTTRSAGLILGLPARQDLFGPVTWHRLIRFWSLYASLFGVGTLLALLAPQAAMKHSSTELQASVARGISRFVVASFMLRGYWNTAPSARAPLHSAARREASRSS